MLIVRRNVAGLRYPLGVIASVVWSIVFIAILVKFAIKPYSHSVYGLYAEAGRAWWYPETNPATEKSIYISQVYAPFVAELLGPFCGLPDRFGGGLWSVAGVGLLVLGFSRLIGAACQHWSANERALAWLLLPWPGVTSVFNGQLNTWIAGMLAIGVAMAVERRWSLAAIALAAATLTKTYPAALALVLIGLYPRQLAVRYLMAVAALLLVSFALHPWDRVLDRYNLWVDYLQHGLDRYPTNMVTVDFRHLLARWGLEISRRQLLPLQAVAGGLVFVSVVVARRRGADHHQQVLQSYTLAAAWMVLFGPATEEATYLLAAPALALFGVEAIRRRDYFAAALWLFPGPLQTSIFGETIRRAVLAAKLAPLAMSVYFVRELLGCMAAPATHSNIRVDSQPEVRRAA